MKAVHYTTGPTFRVVVGPEKKEFWIHQELAKSVSGFFRGCLEGGFKETDSNTIDFSQDDSEVFGYIVNWMYHGSVASIKTMKQLNTLIRADILADRLLMSICQNDIVDEIRRFHIKNSIYTETLKLAQELHTSNEDPLPKFLADQLAYDLNQNEKYYFNPDQITLNPDCAEFFNYGGWMVERVVQGLMKLKFGQTLGHENPAERSGCVYHVHSGDDATCKSLKRGCEGDLLSDEGTD